MNHQGSTWASPVVLVQKKNGGVCFCVDYCRLNQVTELDVFLLPRVDDTLDLLADSHFFSSLDFALGYWQVAMDQDSKVFSGLFQFWKMPFGLVNAPATFQRLIEIMSGLAKCVCLLFT